METVTIDIGLRFSSYDEVRNFMKTYSDQEKETFRLRGADKIKENSFKQVVNEKLFYKRLIYKCKFGNDVKMKGIGERKTR